MEKGFKFVEVTIVPPLSEKYYQLITDGIPTSCIFSESHLMTCFQAIEDYERTNNN